MLSKILIFFKFIVVSFFILNLQFQNCFWCLVLYYSSFLVEICILDKVYGLDFAHEVNDREIIGTYNV